jgi:hypothetical protein
VFDFERHSRLEIIGRDNCHGPQANGDEPVRGSTS